MNESIYKVMDTDEIPKKIEEVEAYLPDAKIDAYWTKFLTKYKESRNGSL